MSDAYKHDVAQVSTLVKNLRSTRDKYNDKIETLKALVDEINTSTSWIDITIKDEFINTCNSYLTLYKEHSEKMGLYEDYLAFKSGEMSDIEDKHTLEGGKYE